MQVVAPPPKTSPAPLPQQLPFDKSGLARVELRIDSLPVDIDGPAAEWEELLTREQNARGITRWTASDDLQRKHPELREAVAAAAQRKQQFLSFNTLRIGNCSAGLLFIPDDAPEQVVRFLACPFDHADLHTLFPIVDEDGDPFDLRVKPGHCYVIPAPVFTVGSLKIVAELGKDFSAVIALQGASAIGSNAAKLEVSQARPTPPLNVAKVRAGRVFVEPGVPRQTLRVLVSEGAKEYPLIDDEWDPVTFDVAGGAAWPLPPQIFGGSIDAVKFQCVREGAGFGACISVV
jgi:hypothetical protein